MWVGSCYLFLFLFCSTVISALLHEEDFFWKPHKPTGMFHVLCLVVGGVLPTVWDVERECIYVHVMTPCYHFVFWFCFPAFSAIQHTGEICTERHKPVGYIHVCVSCRCRHTITAMFSVDSKYGRGHTLHTRYTFYCRKIYNLPVIFCNAAFVLRSIDSLCNIRN